MPFMVIPAQAGIQLHTPVLMGSGFSALPSPGMTTLG